MIHTMKTNDGVVGFGAAENLDELVTDLMKALGYCNDEEDDEDEPEEAIDNDDLIDTTETIESNHLVSVAYNDDTDIVVINYDTPAHPWAVASALLEAAAEMWPLKIPKDHEFVEALRDLAAMGRDIGNDSVENN